jgi:hypothetical protein
MEPDELSELYQQLASRHERDMELLSSLPIAQSDTESTDLASDVSAEGLFMRCFSEYEAVVELILVHYIGGGQTLSGRSRVSFVRSQDSVIVKRIVRGHSQKGPSYSNPSKIIETSQVYIEDGWPVSQVFQSKTQILSDAEKIRNRIAHQSDESLLHFRAVQRNILGTERPFRLRPGHLLRIRLDRKRGTVANLCVLAMHEAICAAIAPEF